MRVFLITSEALSKTEQWY